jgi:diguanylate cyclase (GGDEF)-like protein
LGCTRGILLLDTVLGVKGFTIQSVDLEGVQGRMRLFQTAKLLKHLDNVLDWSPVRKANLVLMVLLPIFLQYLLFHLYQIFDPNFYINYSVLIKMTPIQAMLVVICIAMIMASRRLDAYAWAQQLVPVVYILFYAFSLLYLAYMTGLWSIAVGLVLAGAPLFGFILFTRRLIYLALGTSLLLLLGMSILIALNILPYAPLFQSGFWVDPEAKPFLFICMLFFSAPHLISIILLSDLLLIHWRKREEVIHRISLTDSLTNLANRRSITNTLQIALQYARTTSQPTSVILVDLDHFKRINDHFGHLLGDEALRKASDALKQGLRKDDHLGRYGGEEFLLVLSNTVQHEAVMIAERCRKLLEQTLLWSDGGERIVLTASFGVYCTLRGEENLEEVVRQVDRCLYAAKENGRNQVCAAGQTGYHTALIRSS